MSKEKSVAEKTVEVSTMSAEEITAGLESGTLQECPNCGQIHVIVESQVVDGEYVCSECFADAVQCRECGNWYWKSDCQRDRSSDEYVCQHCMEDNELYVCEDCGKICSDATYIWGGDKYVCADCEEDYSACDRCGRWHRTDEMHCDDNGTAVCDDCYDRYYYTCERCGRIIHRDDANWRHDDPYCYDCYVDCCGSVHEYGYKPTPIFLQEIDEENSTEPLLYMGVELETDGGYRSDVSDDNAWVYYKEDGSLSDEGIEIVSHPATLGFHENQLGWDDICSEFISQGYRSHQTDCCGLHVHVNRDFFGASGAERDMHIAKVVLLVNRFYDSHLEKFCRRSSAQWARKLCVKPRASESDSEIASDIRTAAENAGRYVAVNLQNRNTIEFRIFRGTLKVSTLYATIEFVDTLCRFAKHISLRDVDNVQWSDIFANLDREEYHCLFDYMNERHMEDPLCAPERQIVNTVPFSDDDAEDTRYYVDRNVCYDIGVYENLGYIYADRMYYGTVTELGNTKCMRIRTGSYWGDSIVPVAALYRVVD